MIMDVKQFIEIQKYYPSLLLVSGLRNKFLIAPVGCGGNNYRIKKSQIMLHVNANIIIFLKFLGPFLSNLAKLNKKYKMDFVL